MCSDAVRLDQGGISQQDQVGPRCEQDDTNAQDRGFLFTDLFWQLELYLVWYAQCRRSSDQEGWVALSSSIA